MPGRAERGRYPGSLKLAGIRPISIRERRTGHPGPADGPAAVTIHRHDEWLARAAPAIDAASSPATSGTQARNCSNVTALVCSVAG